MSLLLLHRAHELRVTDVSKRRLEVLVLRPALIIGSGARRERLWANKLCLQRIVIINLHYDLSLGAIFLL